MPALNPHTAQIYVTDFGRLVLPQSVVDRVTKMRWRYGEPWRPDRRFKAARAWSRYETRVKEWAAAEYKAGRDPYHAPEWDAEHDGP